MIKLIEEFIEKYKLNIKNKKVVVAVSTGVDSMTLLYVLEQLNLDIVVAHVNHGKRLQSIEEEAYIRNYCSKKGHKIHVLKLTHDDFSNSNFQEEARLKRLDFFNEVLKEENSDYLFLAHHLNDDIETMIMRLLRGSNLKGLSGIDELTIVNNKYILRPFLNCLKMDIIEYANQNNIKYYEDQSNSEDDYTRNIIRHNIVKKIVEKDKDAYQKFINYKKTINDYWIVTKDIRDEFIKKNIVFNYDSFSFSKKVFNELDEFFQYEVLFELLKKYDLSKVNIKEFIKYINSNKSNLKIDYLSFTFVKEYDKIRVFYNKIEDSNVNIVINDFGVYKISESQTLMVTKKSNKTITNSKIIWYYSNNFPFIVRSRQDGDKMMLEVGSKKVNDILKDMHLGVLERDRVLLLVKDDEVLSIINYRKSTKLKEIQDCDTIIALGEQNEY